MNEQAPRPAPGRPTYKRLAATCLVVILASQGGAANAKRTSKPPSPDQLITDFAALATVRPKTCPAQTNSAPPGWQLDGAAVCAWQGRLRLVRWSAQPPGANACVSRAAQWWAGQRRNYGIASGPGAAWRVAWTSQWLFDDRQPEKRIARIERSADGAWRASEWTWQPSPRAATRQWQQGRWQLLAAALSARAAPTHELGSANPALRAVWEKNLGIRPGEIAGDVWQWPESGLCLRVDSQGLSQGQLHLPYLAADSRLEQRAAMHVQLARRYPKAHWITPFRLTTTAAQTPPRGGAKFEAIWFDAPVLKGQLWIPTRNDGPVLRLRINTVLPLQPPVDPAAPALLQAAAVVERELGGLARHWTAAHE